MFVARHLLSSELNTTLSNSCPPNCLLPYCTMRWPASPCWLLLPRQHDFVTCRPPHCRPSDNPPILRSHRRRTVVARCAFPLPPTAAVADGAVCGRSRPSLSCPMTGGDATDIALASTSCSVSFTAPRNARRHNHHHRRHHRHRRRLRSPLPPLPPAAAACPGPPPVSRPRGLTAAATDGSSHGTLPPSCRADCGVGGTATGGFAVRNPRRTAGCGGRSSCCG